MTEAQYTAAIGKKLPPNVFAWKICARYANGVPDAWYSGKGGDIWIEYKYYPQKLPQTFTPKLTKLQLRWLRDRRAEGRNVAVIVGSPEGAIVLEDLEWEYRISTSDYTVLSKDEVAAYITRQVA